MDRWAFLATVNPIAAAEFLRSVGLATAIDGQPQKTFQTLVETVLPFEDPTFPIVSSDAMVARMEALFHLQESPEFMGSLESFARIGDFSIGSELLFRFETMQSPGVDVRAALAHDANGIAAARIQKGLRFEQLAAVQRSQYLRLWSRSAFNVRRRFYQSFRYATLAAFYSIPEAWKAIGYAGPILGAQHQ